jgi:hypothetical protein
MSVDAKTQHESHELACQKINVEKGETDDRVRYTLEYHLSFDASYLFGPALRAKQLHLRRAPSYKH